MKILKVFILSHFFIVSTFAQPYKGSFIINSLTSTSQFVTMTNNLDVEEIGKLHNEGLEYILTGLIQQKIKSSDTRYATVSIELLNQFCESKGIQIKATFNGNFKQWQTEQPASICNYVNNISAESSLLLCNINETIERIKLEQISIAEFSSLMDNFIASCKGLKIEKERLLVSLTASIAKHSFQYWEKNFETKFAEFDALELNSSGSSQVGKFKIRWWAVAVADVAGAVNWGLGGAAIGGPGGAVAAGLVGACYQSGTSILSQHVLHTILN